MKTVTDDLPEELSKHARLIWSPMYAFGITLRQPTRTVVLATAHGSLDGASLSPDARTGLIVLGRAGCVSGVIIDAPDGWHWIPWHRIEVSVRTKWSVVCDDGGRSLADVLEDIFHCDSMNHAKR